MFRPAKELKGFKKVFIKAGETAEVDIPFDERTFRYFNVKTNKWEVEGGTYSIMIGASVEDIRLSDSLAVEGTTDVLPYDATELPSYYSGQAADVSADEFKKLLGAYEFEAAVAKGEKPPVNTYPLPQAGYKFYKRKRMVIHYNCTIADLRYSKRWFGRLFSGGVRFLRKFLWKIGKRTTSNTIEMGMVHQPVRGMAKFAGMNRAQMDGIILMCNGKFFKGLKQLRTGKVQVKKKKGKDKKTADKA